MKPTHKVYYDKHNNNTITNVAEITTHLGYEMIIKMFLKK